MDAPERYRQLRKSARIRERALFPPERMPNELELQARWFAGDFGKSFVSTAGDTVEIVQFGIWNREAGPDFSEAVVRINGGEPVRGAIEFDLVDRNWEAHGHGSNPQFNETVLHVFVNAGESAFFTRTSAHRNVPQVRVNLAMLPDSFATNIPLARPGRCHAPLRGLAEARVRSVLDAAAQFRLQRKAARLRNLAAAHGRDSALFQEIAGALGYKQNKLPFVLLAQRLPLKQVREPSGEALLFGAAGFLDAVDLKQYSAATRGYVRELWERWWPMRDQMHRLALPKNIWRLTGTRPLNHPQRRLGAMALLAQKWPAFLKSLGKTDGSGAAEFLGNVTHPFWDFHYTLKAKPTEHRMALIGEARVADILANVLFPWLNANGRETWNYYAKLAAPLSNRRVETAATRLFADDPQRPAFSRTVAQQQGLLQIYEDFCLQDNSDCTQCPFPEQMQKWK